MSILILNAGSSSLKFAVFTPDGAGVERLLAGQVAGIGSSAVLNMTVSSDTGQSTAGTELGMCSHAEALSAVLERIGGIVGSDTLTGAGHRIVHGGGEFVEPSTLTAATLDRLAMFEPLAPLHQPHNLAAVRTLGEIAPDLPQVGCFDTAFHATIPEVATELGLPSHLRESGLRRYGFHGLSYQSIVARFAGLARKPLPARVVVAHLGNGSSMCAISHGKSIATTMGFSTLDGIPMGTRSGALDPGVILHLLRSGGTDLAALENILYFQSGLLGVSGVSSDMKRLLDSDQPGAARAVDYFCYRVGRELGSLVAALGGVDALIFTGGIGENAAPVRQRILDASAWLGFCVDEHANADGAAQLTHPGAGPQAWVMPSDEEAQIAKLTIQLLAKK